MVANIQLKRTGLPETMALSPAQRELLFLHNRAPVPAGVDFDQLFCDLHEDLDVAAFQRAWQKTVGRHAILRTCFEGLGQGTPRQVVLAPSRKQASLAVRSVMSERELEDGLEEFLAADRHFDSDPGRAPLHRLTLIRAGEAHFWLVFTFHRSLLDQPALTVVLQDAFGFYDAEAEGKSFEPAEPVAYTQYIDWLQTIDHAEAEKFWRRYLAGFRRTTSLVLPRPFREGEAADDFARELKLELPSGATHRLYAFAAENEISVGDIAEGLWALLLGRQNGVNDVVFGVHHDGRDVPVDGAGSIVGVLAQTVPVRVTIEPEAMLADWLRKLHAAAQAMPVSFQHVASSHLHDWSELGADQPLFETAFSHQPETWEEHMGALVQHGSERHFGLRRHGPAPLLFETYGGQKLGLRLVFDRTRFRESTMLRLLGRLRTALETVAQDPHRTVGSIPLPAAFDWSATRTPPAAAPAHHFETRSTAA